YNKGTRSALNDISLDPLVVMDVCREHKIWHASGIVNRMLHRICHVGAATMVIVKRIDGVMQAHDQSLILWRSCKFVCKPLLLHGINRSVFRNVRVHANYCSIWTDKSEINVW